jgi:hypothetical protein
VENCTFSNARNVKPAIPETASCVLKMIHLDGWVGFKLEVRVVPFRTRFGTGWQTAAKIKRSQYPPEATGGSGDPT